MTTKTQWHPYQYKKLTLAACMAFFMAIGTAFGTNYATIADGDWNNSATWQGGNIPPNFLDDTDTVFVNHDVDLNANYNLDSAMLVVAHGKDLSIGANDTLVSAGVVMVHGDLKFTATGASFTNNGRVKGTGSLTGNFVNPVGGILAPGYYAPSDRTDKITFAGNFINYGTIELELEASNSHDQINFNNSGNIDIFGTLTILLINGYLPGSNDAFNVVIGASGREGEFTTVNWPPLYTGAIKYKSNGILIEGVVLPVELTEFSARDTRTGVELAWKTVTESENLGFYVERSRDGLAWQDLAFVPGHGTTREAHDYLYLDEKAMPGINYYRLRQLDFSGGEVYSPVEVVEVGGRGPSVQVWPNPATSAINVLLSEAAVLTIFDGTGRLVASKSVTESGATVLDISDLPSGIFFLNAITASGSETLRFVKK